MTLLNYRKDEFSTTGNDGIIEEILGRLHIGTGLCVEFGAGDGVRGSNTRRLINKGWTGIFIENDHNKYDALTRNYHDNLFTTCIHEAITPSGRASFDKVIEPFVRGTPIDFCSIGIDGLDLEVFEGIEKNLPTVVCIKGGQMFHPHDTRKPKTVAVKNMQQPLKVMRNAFEGKGYELVCTHQDSFFIKLEAMERGDIEDYICFNDDICNNTIDYYFEGLMHHPRRIPWIMNQLAEVREENEILSTVLDLARVRKVHSGKEWTEHEVLSVVQAIFTFYKGM